MPLLRQLEFGFRNTAVDAAVVGQALRLPSANGATEAVALQRQARQLLCANGAGRIVSELRVEWNARLRTCAGRADYRRKLITLNPRLRDHPSEVDRTLRHELAHFLAQFRAGRRRISPHGLEWREACRDLGVADEKRCHDLPFSTRAYAARFIYRCPNCRQEFRRIRRVRRAVACLACCRAYNRGKFDARFRLRIMRACELVIPSEVEESRDETLK